MTGINRHPSRRELRQFSGIWLPAFCGLVGGLILYHTGWLAAAIAIWAAGAVIGTLGLIRPQAVRPIFVGWMTAAYPVGWLISRAILAAVFFLLLTPIALVLRCFRPDPLGRRFEPSRESYWVEHEAVPDRSRYFRQF